MLKINSLHKLFHLTPFKTFFASVIVSILLTFSIVSFINSYYRLIKAVQKERTDYISEISRQLLSSIISDRARSIEELMSDAKFVENNNPKTFKEFSKFLSKEPPIEYMLASKNGKLIRTNGIPASLEDGTFLKKIQQSSKFETGFNVLDKKERILLFSTPISTQNVEGDSYNYLIMGVPTRFICQRFSIPIFKKIGGAYMITDNGTITLRPNNKSAKFQDENLFINLSSLGANFEDLYHLKKNVATKSSGSNLVNINSEKWLFCFQKGQKDRFILIVAMPLTLAAEGTYKGIFSTLVFATLTIFFFALLILVIFKYFTGLEKQRLAQEASIKAQADFLSKMSHDLRTPLSAIIGTLSIIKKQNLSPQIHTHITKAERASNYLLELINDVLDIRKLENNKLKITHDPFSLSELLLEVESMIRPLTTEKKISFEITKFTPLDTNYYGDAVRIKQILMNLLSNAVKFTRPNGFVELMIYHNKQNDKSDKICFEVKDSGIGMSETFLKKIFTPFEQEQSSYTASTMGSGLGLSIVKTLVSLMHGTINVQSELKKGSSFVVSFPLDRCSKSIIPPADPVKPVTFSGQRILLAEDNIMNQQIISEILSTNLNLKIETVSNGEDAVEKVKSNPPGYYFAILMDMRMPIMDGNAATRAIRNLNRTDVKSIPIFALSANTQEEDVQNAFHSGITGYFSKPIDIARVAKELFRLLQ